jgi:hypothetical protein
MAFRGIHSTTHGYVCQGNTRQASYLDSFQVGAQHLGELGVFRLALRPADLLADIGRRSHPQAFGDPALADGGPFPQQAGQRHLARVAPGQRGERFRLPSGSECSGALRLLSRRGAESMVLSSPVRKNVLAGVGRRGTSTF